MKKTVEEFTTINPVTIDLNSSLDEALKTMQKEEIRHLLVTEESRLVGIISERDVLSNFKKKWSAPLRVKEIMNPDILFAQTGDEISDVAFRLSKNKKGSAVILDASGTLYGIFTTTDALNALVESN